jgi:hypothetical protein
VVESTVQEIGHETLASCSFLEETATLTIIVGSSFCLQRRTTRLLLPFHLVDQWHSEIGKFLPDLKDEVIVLGSGKAAHFAKLTIRQVLKAKIIIVAWDNCTKPPYLKIVATLAGLVEPAVN